MEDRCRSGILIESSCLLPFECLKHLAHLSTLFQYLVLSLLIINYDNEHDYNGKSEKIFTRL